MITFVKPIEFVWDKGNQDKNWRKHKVANNECEEAFTDKNKKIYKDELHSDGEKRFILLGKTKKRRLLFVAFTQRGKKARVISARDIYKQKARKLYEKNA